MALAKQGDNDEAADQRSGRDQSVGGFLSLYSRSASPIETPTPIATVKSTRTVNIKVTRSNKRSLTGVDKYSFHLWGSLMRHAVMSNKAARAGMARYPAIEAKSPIAIRMVTACTSPATGVRPPALILVAVLAMAPVAGMPLNKDDATFAAPVPAIPHWACVVP